MKEYETLGLFLPDTSPEKIEALVQRLSEVVKTQGGNMLTTFNWGKRRLAYPVEKNHHGIFVYFNYLSAGATVAEIERILKFEDQVLKFITVKLADEVNVAERLTQKREVLLSSLEDFEERESA